MLKRFLQWHRPFHTKQHLSTPDSEITLLLLGSLGDISFPWPRGDLVDLAPPNKALSTPNLNMKHYNLVEFLSNLNVKPPLLGHKAPPHKRKTPYWGLSGDGYRLYTPEGFAPFICGNFLSVACYRHRFAMTVTKFIAAHMLWPASCLLLRK